MARLLKWRRPANYRIEDTLVVAGSPRSGTTWLAEIVANLPGTAILFEPLYAKRVKLARQAGFTGRNDFRAPEEWDPQAENYMRAVLQGDVLTPWTASYVPLTRLLDLRRWVVKFTRANHLLAWMVRHFPIRPPLFIIRHPCAAFASRVGRGWGILKWAPRGVRFLEHFPQFMPVVEALRTPEEFWAAQWAMQQYAPLHMCTQNQIHIVSYEQLLLDGSNVVNRFLDHWKLEPPRALGNQLLLPSAKASRAYSVDRKEMLIRWQSQLTTSQIDSILSVAASFGIDFYGTDVEPNYDRMAAACRPQITNPASDSINQLTSSV